jgi:AraC-like DNA-binding protein
MLYALFRQEMGCSPREYREQFLLRKSKTLLLNSTMGIDEIAETCGMCDRYYFSNRFKKLFGISPAAFRKGADS